MIGSLLCLGELQAQTPRSRPLLDGLTVGPGLSMYSGDLDGNQDGNVIKYFGLGRFGFMVAGDRRFGNASVGAELHFDQIKVDRVSFAFTNNLISLDLVGGYHIDLFRPGLFRLVGGVGLTLAMPSYDRAPDNVAGVKNPGTRPLLTFPVSLGVQDRIRLGMRLTLTDYLDGFEGSGGKIDLIPFFNIGYRFNFVN